MPQQQQVQRQRLDERANDKSEDKCIALQTVSKPVLPDGKLGGFVELRSIGMAVRSLHEESLHEESYDEW